MSIWKERLQVFFQYKDLLFQLVQRDVKLKYRRSFLGYVWSVLNPLLIMLVMTVVFSTMFQRKITNYPPAEIRLWIARARKYHRTPSS